MGLGIFLLAKYPSAGNLPPTLALPREGGGKRESHLWKGISSF